MKVICGRFLVFLKSSAKDETHIINEIFVYFVKPGGVNNERREGRCINIRESWRERKRYTERTGEKTEKQS